MTSCPEPLPLPRGPSARYPSDKEQAGLGPEASPRQSGLPRQHSMSSHSDCPTVRKLAVAGSERDVEAAIARAGAVPRSWSFRQSEILDESSYTRSSVLVDNVLAHPERFSGAKQRVTRFLAGARSAGVGSREVADSIVAPGVNPFAVDQMGIDLLRGFRVKSFTLMVLQAGSALAVAIGVDSAISDDPTVVGWPLFGAFCGTTVVMLVLVAAIRHLYPWNYLAGGLFTLVAGTTLGLMSFAIEVAAGMLAPDQRQQVSKPQIYTLGFYNVGLCVVGLLSVVKDSKRERLMRCLPVSIIAALVVSGLLFLVWGAASFCPLAWLIIILVVVSTCLVWVGYECDKLATKLNPDEYVLPIVLVWADLLVLMVVVLAAIGMVCCLGGAGGADCTPCGLNGADGAAVSWCECGPCWVYDDGSYHQPARKQVSPNPEDFHAATPPPGARTAEDSH